MPSTTPADLVIENISVITMDANHPLAAGVAIAKGKILGLLTEKDEKWPLAPNGKRINGKGLTLLPGLIDAHCHLRAQISRNFSISCSRRDVTSIREIIETIQNQAQQLPYRTWIRASGYEPFYLQEKRQPTRWDLDRATSDHPVRLRHVTRHASVLNSTALSLAGIGPYTADPPGVTVERQAESCIPTGLIHGGDAWLSQHVIPPLSLSELRTGADQLQASLLSKGITAVQDATPTNTAFDLEFWASKMKKDWPITIQIMANEKNHASMAAFLVNNFPAELENRLEMGAIKVVMEANPEISPAVEELTEIASKATRRNVPIAVHVVNPEMVLMAIEAIRSATQHTKKSIRHRLEHLSLCPEAFLADIKELGMMVVTNPSLIHEHGDRYLSNVEVSEQDWLYRMSSVKTSEIPLAAGSDAPVVSFDPWIGMQTACTRATTSGQFVKPDEKLDRWNALSMYTCSAALAGGWENCRGKIKPGYNADLIAIDQNPLTCSVDTLGRIRVHATWIEGKLVYRSP